jgi:hypothetical protein
VDKVERASAQLVDQLELSTEIPNWALLYQVVVVRETARQLSKLVDESGVYNETVISGSFAPSELPKAEAALIKELVVLNSVAERRGMLAKILDEMKEALDASLDASTVENGKMKLKATTRGFERRIEGSAKRSGFNPKDLRPGRLIDSIINLRVSLAREGESSKPVVQRLGQLYFEACDVVMENANVG